MVSSIHCGCSNPGSDPGQGSILLSGNRNMTLLFATSSYSWILCLKLTGVLCCLPAAKTAGRLQTEVLAQNHGKCPRATYFMPKKWTEWDRFERPRKLAANSGGPGSALKNPPLQDEMWQPTFSSLRSLSLRSCDRVVKAMDLKSIGVSPRRFEPCRLRVVIDLSL